MRNPIDVGTMNGGIRIEVKAHMRSTHDLRECVRCVKLSWRSRRPQSVVGSGTWHHKNPSIKHRTVQDASHTSTLKDFIKKKKQKQERRVSIIAKRTLYCILVGCPVCLGLELLRTHSHPCLVGRAPGWLPPSYRTHRATTWSHSPTVPHNLGASSAS